MRDRGDLSMIRYWGPALLLLLGLAAQEARAQTRSAALDSLIKAAAAEGELNILSSSPDNPTAWGKLQAAMRSKYGINVALRHTPGPVPTLLTGRIVEEYKSGKPSSTDALMSAETNLPAAVTAGLLQSVNWREYVPELPKDAIAPENSSIAWATVLRGITYNTRLVSKERVPRTLEDLLDPRWKGKIASTPQGVGFVPAAMIVGEERMTRFVTELARGGNLKGLVQCGEDQRLAAGEFAMQVFACNNRDVELLRRKGAPLNHVLLEAVPMVSNLYWGVPKNSAHPNMARLFAIFMWTPEAQEILWEHEGFDLHYVKGSHVGKELQDWRAKGIEPRLIGANEVFTLGMKAYQEQFAKYQKILRGDR